MAANGGAQGPGPGWCRAREADDENRGVAGQVPCRRGFISSDASGFARHSDRDFDPSAQHFGLRCVACDARGLRCGVVQVRLERRVAPHLDVHSKTRRCGACRAVLSLSRQVPASIGTRWMSWVSVPR